ncbi:hypothetical protein HCN44_000771 [Aphidius gifuensis]|uniref:Membrane metallo-endopeptidase-like 1 n=1 Tax=Aphidius gifuensis TaxID=684658 RepID=A0A834XRM5_APHGI|nr:hypothetical protein HCN44_000771 [Aphidius gifuensis]
MWAPQASNIISSMPLMSYEDDRSSNSLSSMGDSCEAEITASILEVNGGPIPTDTEIVKKSRARLQFRKNVLMRSLVDHNRTTKFERSYKKLEPQNEAERKNSTIKPPMLTQHPDDFDFFCLVDTTKKISKEEEREKNNYYFEFRGYQPSSDANDAFDVCETQACVNAASRIIKMGNPSVEPCEDFYEFACGGFLNSTESTRNSIEIDSFTEVDTKFYKRLEKILEQNITTNDFKYLKLAKSLYKICSNKIDIFVNSMEPSGGWPVLKGSNWNESAFDFNKTIFRMDNKTKWENYFFVINLHDDDSSVTVRPYPSDITAPWCSGGYDSTSLNRYYNSMIEYAQTMNASDKNTNYTDDLKKLINFEIELCSARFSDFEMNEHPFDTVNMTLYELEKNYSFFNWKEYITYCRGSAVNSSTTIIIENLSYMKKLQDLLNSTVTKRTLANYVMHKHLRDSDLLINLLSPHYEQCAEFVSTKLPIAVGAIYVQSYNRSWIMNAKDNISKMTLKIKEKFCEIIKEADGIDQETKKRMEEKLQLTTHIIGRLNDFTNNTKVDKFHEDFELFYEDNFFDAAIQLLVKNMTRDDHIWFYSALSMTYSFTMFDPSSNRTSISYTFPESEFFDSEQPNYINYGAMGYLIGDLIAKILNNYGSHFDLYELDPDERAYDSLWTLTSTRNFKNKSKCFIEQYSNYKVKELGLNLNGRIFRNINVADHGGIKAAYRAYNDLSTSDQRLPGYQPSSDDNDAFDVCETQACVNAGTQPSSADNNASDICETHACVHAASRIIKMGNPSVEPCDDFYEFACGSFVNPTESDRKSIVMDTFTELTSKFNKKLEKILEQNITINDFKYLKLAKTLYKICFKKNDIFANSMEPSGGWPVVKGSKWNESAFDFNKTIFRVDNTTRWENYFFKFDSYDDYSSVTVEPYPSELIADWYFEGLNNTMVNIYYNLMIQYAQVMNASDNNTNYVDDLEKLINFKIELGSARLTLNQMADPFFDTVNMTLYELEKDYSFFNWEEYITYLRGSPVNSSTTIIIKNFSYMKKLRDLLNSTVTKRTLANYVMWKHLRNYDKLSLLSINNSQCVQFVSSRLPIAVGAIHVQNFNRSRMINTEDNILKMTLKIKEKFLEIIKEADWIDPETERELVNKLQLSKNIIGYINEFTNNSKINEFHEDYELFDENNFFDAAPRIAIQMLGRNDFMWSFIARDMLAGPAQYKPVLNSIIISYEVFESELFDLEQPNYINYGALGSLAGHEITHGFDFSGKQYDAEGHLNDTWTATSTENFNNKSECIIEQYSNYTVKELGLNLNGSISQGENVADHGGIRAAYRAYSDLSITDKRLPGLFYTPKQMFWISYATMWCQKTTPELLKMLIFDSHPPYKFRVTGTLSNMPEFAKDFKCPSGSNMNPVKKCSVCVEPCEDFYEFACGGFLKPTEPDRNSIEMDSLTKLTYKLNKKLEKILEQNITNNDFEYLKLTKTLYKICLKKTDIFVNSMEVSGGWPVLKGSKWNESSFDFNKTIFRIDNTTKWKNYFFKFELLVHQPFIIVEPFLSEKNAEYFRQGRNDTKVKDYYNFLIKSAQAFNASHNNTNYTDDLEKLIDFEIELSNLRLQQMSDPSSDTVNMTLYELKKNYSFFNWEEYITYLCGSPVNSSTTIIIKNFSYMKKLQDLLNSTVTKRTLANYVMWKHLIENDKLSLLSINNSQCVQFVSSRLPIAVGAIHVQNFNRSRMINTEDNILKMTLKIKEKFLEIIKEADWIDPETERELADWIDPETKREIVNKLKLSKNIIGYINEFTNNSKIIQFHEDFELFYEENFFGEAARTFEFYSQKMKKSNENSWALIAMIAMDQLAFTFYQFNSIAISYKWFESELFDSEQPNYINYGAMGYIIGHEITHGFDNKGRKYDADGHDNDTWTATSIQNFNNKSKCIIEQYSNYTVKELGLNLNGGISQGENVADHGGIRAAYRAYNDLSTTEKRLPGLSYTPKQMFWISYAHVWCQRPTLELLKLNVADVHPPNKFRVIGPLSNMPEFAKDFECPSGSKMNPVKKCSVW